jgi:surface carbohydrate biosynthesis protein
MLRRLRRAVPVIFSGQIDWLPPKQRPVVLIHADGFNSLTKFVDASDVAILDPERINFFVVLKMLLSFQFSHAQYRAKFINTVQPKVVITFIDNDVTFYSLKRVIHGPRFVSVQNGLRHNYSFNSQGGLLDQLEEVSKHVSLTCDYICVFGLASAKLFSTYINSKTLITGSIQNNFREIGAPSAMTSDVVFVSQLQAFTLEGSTVKVYFGNQGITISEFFEVERQIVRALDKYCEEKELRLVICGKRDQTHTYEREFFENILQPKKPNFLIRESGSSTYDAIDATGLVVTIDSTIGYESLSIGKRVAFMSGRTQSADSVGLAQIRDTNFGYPLDLPAHGNFWTNQATATELTRILDHLRAVTDEEWATEIAPYNETLMAYQPGNPVFKKLLLDLGLTLIDGVKSDA